MIKKTMPFLVENLCVTDKLLGTLEKQKIVDAAMVKAIKVCSRVNLILKYYYHVQ